MPWVDLWSVIVGCHIYLLSRWKWVTPGGWRGRWLLYLLNLLLFVCYSYLGLFYSLFHLMLWVELICGLWLRHFLVMFYLLSGGRLVTWGVGGEWVLIALLCVCGGGGGGRGWLLYMLHSYMYIVCVWLLFGCVLSSHPIGVVSWSVVLIAEFLVIFTCCLEEN